MNFDDPIIYLFKNGGKKPYRTHRKVDIVSCEKLGSEDKRDLVSEREVRRSKSFLRNLIRDESRPCDWDWGFILKFKEKEYELYSPTRGDQAYWIKFMS